MHKVILPPSKNRSDFRVDAKVTYRINKLIHQLQIVNRGRNLYSDRGVLIGRMRARARTHTPMLPVHVVSGLVCLVFALMSSFIG